MPKHTLVVGDWSDDGHGKCEHYDFECSHDEETVLKGYEDAVKATGVALHSNSKNNYHKNNPLADFVKYEICTRYEDSIVNREVIKALQSVGINPNDYTEDVYDEDDDEEAYFSSLDVAITFMEMAKSQIKDFTYKLVDKPKPINTNKKTYSIGYGTFN